MKELSGKPEVKAIGECGLDRLCNVPWDLQLEAFYWQINLAKEVQKPMIIHCVRAQQDVLKRVKDAGIPFVFHGFNRSLSMANEIIDAGGNLSLSLDFLNTETGQKVASNVNNKFIFLETDDAAFTIQEAYICLAKIWKKEMTEVEYIVAQNANRIGLKLS